MLGAGISFVQERDDQRRRCYDTMPGAPSEELFLVGHSARPPLLREYHC
jgi:hypothetical protein